MSGKLEIQASNTPDNLVEDEIEEITMKTGDTLNECASSTIYRKVVGYLIPRLKDCATGKVNNFHF